jgi:hypothetical protein
MNELRERKEYMIDLMLQIKGDHYTMGWLKSSWLWPLDADIDAKVVEKTIAELEANEEAARV